MNMFNNDQLSVVETIFGRKSLTERVPGTTLDLMLVSIALTSKKFYNLKVMYGFAEVCGKCFDKPAEEAHAILRDAVRTKHKASFENLSIIAEAVTLTGLRKTFDRTKEETDHFNRICSYFDVIEIND
jgi:hypothetical protein